MWRQLAEIGMLGLGFDREESGPIEIMVVMTEIGRRLAPEPVADAALIPGGLIAELGSRRAARAARRRGRGRRLLAFAHTEPGMRGLSRRGHPRRPQGDAWTVTGRQEPGTGRRLRPTYSS